MAGRFRFSFPPRRHHDDPWFRIGTLDVTSTMLVTLICSATIFLWALDPVGYNSQGQLDGILRWFILIPEDVRDGQLWRILTWPFVSRPDPQFLWTIIRIALFWYFGRELEAQVGRVRFAFLLLWVTLAAGLLATALDVPLAGLRFLEVGVFALYVADQPLRPFFFGIPAWIVGVVFIGAEFLDLLTDRIWELIYILAGSIAVALLVGRHFGLASDQKWIPHLAPRKSAKAPRRSRASKQSAVVVAGPWGAPSVASSDQAEVDHLLDKIAANGYESLTADEKRRLKEASERLRRERG